MKTIKAIILLLVMSSGAWATDYTQDASCIGAWLFSEGSGTTLTDASSTGNNGTIDGATWSLDKPGAFSAGSLSFDGNDDYVTLTDPSVTSTLTVVAFIKLNSSTDQTQHIISYYTGFFISRNSDNIRFCINDTANTVYGSAADLTAWHHYAGVYNSSGGSDNVIAYLDGSPVATATTSGNIDTSGNFNIGNYASGHTNYGTNGYITEVAIFTRVLSSTEINDIMTNGLKGSGSPTPSIVDNQIIQVMQ